MPGGLDRGTPVLPGGRGVFINSPVNPLIHNLFSLPPRSPWCDDHHGVRAVEAGVPALGRVDPLVSPQHLAARQVGLFLFG